MSSISSLSVAVSALMSSQTALNTTAHNLSNVNTPGYVRQQVLFQDSRYSNIGRNATTGFYKGLGVDVQVIRQVRDRFLDQAFRQENSRHGFYSAHANTIEEIETILGEIEGESFANVLNDLWTSINELSKTPDGLETRGSLIQNAVKFVNRANLISEQLSSYQSNMNQEVMDMVNKINSLGESISNLNDIIVKQELNGANANDYRDERNKLLDELSNYVDIIYREDVKGNLYVQVEGTEFISLDGYAKMGIAPAEDLSTLVKPIWTHLNSSNNDVFNLNVKINTEYDNDKGALKGLLLARGSKTANYTDLSDLSYYNSNIKPSIIMNAQAQFDNLIHEIVTIINDTLSPVGTDNKLDPNAPYGLNGNAYKGIELFSRKGMPRFDKVTGEYIAEDPNNPYTLYSADNIEINQEILGDYNKITITKIPGEYSDNTVVKSILEAWGRESLQTEPGLTTKYNINNYYTEFISNLGNKGRATNNMVNNQELMTMQIENQRSSKTAVSSDEELSNMIKFQHAYNAAAKVVTVLDQMIEQIVVSTGLVGR